MIDVPCADGRIAIRLAAAGLAVTGIEIAAAEVGRARRAAEEAGVAARFVCGDLRDLPDAGPADGLVSWGNSFGYLAPADTVRSLAGMHRLLRPGGRLVLESMTVAESLLPGGIQPHSEVEFGGIRMARSNRYNAAESRLETDYVLDRRVGRGRAHARRAPRPHGGRGRAPAARRRLRRRAAAGRRRRQRPYALGAPRLIAVATA